MKFILFFSFILFVSSTNYCEKQTETELMYRPIEGTTCNSDEKYIPRTDSYLYIEDDPTKQIQTITYTMEANLPQVLMIGFNYPITSPNLIFNISGSPASASKVYFKGMKGRTTMKFNNPNKYSLNNTGFDYMTGNAPIAIDGDIVDFFFQYEHSQQFS